MDENELSPHPEVALCARHPEHRAERCCERCGDFCCESCLSRARATICRLCARRISLVIARKGHWNKSWYDRYIQLGALLGLALFATMAIFAWLGVPTPAAIAALLIAAPVAVIVGGLVIGGSWRLIRGKND